MRTDLPPAEMIQTRTLQRAGVAPAVVAAAALALAACSPTPPPAAGPAPAAAAEARSSGAELLPLRFDADEGRVLLTIRDLGEPMLYLNSLAGGLGTGGLDRGQVGTDALVHFERRGDRVLLVRENATLRASSDNEAERRAVRESFPRSVLASFPIEGEDGGGLVVDATDFFLSDVYDVIGSARSSGLGTLRVDASRSFIDGERTGSYPLNSEIRAVVTYVTDNPSATLRRHAPDGRAVTLEQQHSFVRLPEEPLALRPFDPRAGLFSSSFFDFSQPFDADYRQRAVARWRLEPSDPAAYQRGELVEPVEPIVYYLDPGIPEPYRTAFLEGGNWWNEIFEAAGWRNAFRVEPLPDGVDPNDARYPVLFWVHRQERGPSVGPSYRDPRSGEILTTHVRMDSYRSLVDFDVYMGLVPAAGAAGLQLDPEEFAMARRRQHTAHEIGHTLGLAHNFLAATQGRSSVMDYPYPLIELDESGALDISRAYSPAGGAHDTLAIRYAYTWYPDEAAEAEGLRQIVRDAEARGLRFITGGHASPASSYPEATQWIEGADMLSALERTMAVRRLLIDSFNERAAQPGEPLAVLNRRFAHVYYHHRYALHGATKAIGGMRFGYAIAGEATEPTAIVPAAEQRRALDLVVANLDPEALRIPSRVAAIIPPVPHGYDSDLTLIRSPTGTAFDPIAAAHSLAQEIVDNLLHPQRAARLASFHSQDRSNPSLGEVLETLVDATWGAPAPAAGTDPQLPALQRVAQRAVLDGLLDLAGSNAATPAVRATTEAVLTDLRDRLRTGGAAFAQEEGARGAALRDIERYFAGEDDPEARPRPEYVPLPWP